MVRPCVKVSLTSLVAVCAWLLLATAGNAENRGRPAATAPMKSKSAKTSADSARDTKSADNSSRAKDDELIDDDSSKMKSGSKETVTKKSARKGTNDSKPTAKKPSSRSRDAGETGQKALMGSDLNLEPET